jgi:DNA-binding transcriptional regulator GbsR (MarR family)
MECYSKLSHERRCKLDVPRDLYERVGDRKRIIQLIKIGLLSLKVAYLEKEIADLTDKIKDSKKHITELPRETERLYELLGKAIEDKEVLEKMLDKGK